MGKLETNWWKKSNDEVPSIVFNVIKYFDKQQSYLVEDNLRNVKLYGNADILGIGAYQYTTTLQSPLPQSRLTLNVIKSCVDTVTNKIAKNKPKPMFLTNGGDWSLQQKAKKMNDFTEALFYKTNLYDIGTMAFRDSCIFDTGGFIKIYRDKTEVKCERVLCSELRFDDIEAFYGTYRTLYQTKLVNRDVLIEMFPSKKNLILNAPEKEIVVGMTQSIADNIEVIESWHIGKDGKDGRHVICIPNGTLVSESWDHDYFPFVSLHWTRPLLGARGQSLATELTGIQMEINRILKTMQAIIRLVVPKLMVEKGSKVVYNHLNNEIGGIIEYSGIKPTYDQLQAIPADLYNQLDRLYQRAFEIAGVSQLAAQAKKPAGLDSGKALREFNDIESERFILKGIEYENMYMKAARQMLRIVRDIYEDEKEFTMPASKKKIFEKLDWGDIDLDESEYSIQAFPVSALSNTPSGRLQDVQEYVQAGFINRQDALRLLDFPDLEAVVSLETAAAEDISSIIEQMIDKGIYQSPEPYQDLAYGIKKMQSAYLRAKMNKVPEERLELLRRWIDEASNSLGLLQEPAPQPQVPLARPARPEESNYLPFAQGQAPIG